MASSLADIALLAAILLLSLVAISVAGSYCQAPPAYALKVTKEMFTNDATAHALLDPKKTVFIQGAGVPNAGEKMGVNDNDVELPTVDGSPDTPHSMNMFAYNKVAPECCPSTYSTDMGCVCQTDKQIDFVAYRGQRNAMGDITA
jgi:hypothetical protein